MKQLRDLLPYLRPYHAMIVWGLLLVVAGNGLTMLSVEAIKWGTDAMSRGGATAGTVGRFALISVGAALVAGAARFGMREILNGVSRRVETDLRDALFAHLLRLDARFYGAHATGEIMSRATNDISAVRMVAGPAYMYLVNTLVFSVLAVTRMTMVSVEMTLAALVPLLLLPPVTIYFGRLIHDRFESIQEQFGVISTMAQENMAGARIVKAYGQEAYQTGRFRALSEDYLHRNVALARVSGLFYPLLSLLAGLAGAVSLWWGVHAIVAGQISVGEFILFVLYLGMLTWPLIALWWVVNLFQRGAASMGRVSRILRVQPDVRDVATPRAPAEVRGEIEFRGVSFVYPGSDRAVLRDVSFHVPAGATVAVVGPTGSGKSTLIALLSRLYDPGEGEVLLDGIPVREWPLEQLRAALAVVPQDTFLFSTSLAENLALGLGEPGGAEAEGRVRAAARVARLHETVASFPLGYDTVLGERGINLSGGQKQRATLARAVARDAPVLVLDDALSAVDPHPEHEILEGLRGVMAGRTSLIVSHRVTATMHADHVLVLEDGRVAERGTHEELLRAGGVYAALQRRQMLAEEVAGDDLLAAGGNTV